MSTHDDLEQQVEEHKNELFARMKIDVPAGKVGNMAVEKFTVPDTISNFVFRLRRYGVDRMPSPGDFTKLVEYETDDENGNTIWMSDTRAELQDHLVVMERMEYDFCERVLINGLGLGAVLQGALSFPHIKHIDVVEQSKEVIDLVGRHYAKDPRVHLCWVDAYKATWPASEEWDVIWHDIWPHISTTNIPGMASLFKKYRDRCGWQGFWALEQSRAQWKAEEHLLLQIIQREGKRPTNTHPLYTVYKEWEREGKYMLELPETNDW